MLGSTALIATLLNGGDVLHRDRSFFGVYAVEQSDDGFHELFMGTTIHGRQLFAEDGPRNTPSSYYHASGPLGTPFEASHQSADIGVVGLGAGEISAYGRA